MACPEERTGDQGPSPVLSARTPEKSSAVGGPSSSGISKVTQLPVRLNHFGLDGQIGGVRARRLLGATIGTRRAARQTQGQGGHNSRDCQAFHRTAFEPASTRLVPDLRHRSEPRIILERVFIAEVSRAGARNSRASSQVTPRVR